MINDSVYLHHIFDSTCQIEEYIQGMDYEDFYSVKLVQDGVIRQLEIIGEATKKLSSDLRDKYSHIPWQDIAGMRDKLIHVYFGVDLDEVWDTAERDIPELKEEIASILRHIEGNVE